MGHDTPDSLHGIPKDKRRQRYDYLLGGVGDARHLFSTLVSICVVEEAMPEVVEAQYHFTIVDLKPAAIARDLVMLLMLGDVDSSPDEEADLLLATIYYIFIAPCMPSFAYNILQSYISRLLSILQGQGTMPSFLSLPKVHNQGVKKRYSDNGNMKQPQHTQCRTYANKSAKDATKTVERRIPPHS